MENPGRQTVNSKKDNSNDLRMQWVGWNSTELKEIGRLDNGRNGGRVQNDGKQRQTQDKRKRFNVYWNTERGEKIGQHLKRKWPQNSQKTLSHMTYPKEYKAY